nr:CDPK-related kinase 5-like [Tanacetum cinerariifolium]
MGSIMSENDMFACHPWIRNSANELNVPLYISILKLMKAYMRSSDVHKGALQNSSKTLTVDELFYLKKRFYLLEPSKNGSIDMETIKATKLSRETGNHRETIGKTETAIEKVTNKRKRDVLGSEKSS